MNPPSPFHYCAHSLEGRPPSEWESLEHHLHAVAELAGDFASAFDAQAWGRAAGLWHDLGKYRLAFQRRLRGSSEAVEHSGVGAAFAHQQGGAAALPLAFVIAGHHAGLANLTSQDSSSQRPLQARLKDNQPLLGKLPKDIPALIANAALPTPPQRFAAGGGEQPARFRSLELWIRFLFSALVDADYLATDAFYSPGQRGKRLRGFAGLPILRRRVDDYLDRFVARLPLKERRSPLNRRRDEVLTACRTAAERPPGLFSLTVPTGGGKTLAALSFALRHAERHGLRRVIAAIPFTTIIEQNAEVYRRALGTENVIEHHSALDPDLTSEEARESELRRCLAAENWDAPVIVTTNVQLFESLFSNRPSRCRKLHNIAGSVLLLDEAQMLPPELLLPVLEVLQELTDNYRCTIVFTTATQPALAHRESLPQGLKGVEEIIPEPRALARELVRVEVSWPEPAAPPTPYNDLAQELRRHHRVLAVVHRRGDARTLARLLPGEGRYHLSALMCPAHRSAILRDVRQQLGSAGPCRLVSTQLIEAGVDIDFPVVYRALGGLDSVAQAAGRCNREARLEGRGKVVVYRAETPPPPGIPRHGLEVAEAMLSRPGQPLDLSNPDTFDRYFRELYLSCPLDAHDVQAARSELALATVAHRFRLIEDGYTRPVVVPYGEALDRLAALRRQGPTPDTLRGLQPFTVNIPERALRALQAAGAIEVLFDTVHAVVELFDGLYRSDFGLVLEGEAQPDPEQLVV